MRSFPFPFPFPFSFSLSQLVDLELTDFVRKDREVGTGKRGTDWLKEKGEESSSFVVLERSDATTSHGTLRVVTVLLECGTPIQSATYSGTGTRWLLALCSVFFSLHYSLPPTRGGGTDPGPVLNV